MIPERHAAAERRVTLLTGSYNAPGGHITAWSEKTVFALSVSFYLSSLSPERSALLVIGQPLAGGNKSQSVKSGAGSSQSYFVSFISI
jgi:hypothetical protein